MLSPSFSTYLCDLKVGNFCTVSRTLAILCLSLLLANTVGAEPPSDAGSKPLPFQTSRTLTTSLAQVLLKHRASIDMLELCASKFKHLNKSAQNARSDWDKKHIDVVTKANKLKDYIYRNIAKHQSLFTAEKLILEVDSKIHQQIQQIKSELENKDRKQQHYLCNRLILAISAGDKDMSKDIPEHQQRVIEYKLNR